MYYRLEYNRGILYFKTQKALYAFIENIDLFNDSVSLKITSFIFE